jgi:hypothetical protein
VNAAAAAASARYRSLSDANNLDATRSTFDALRGWARRRGLRNTKASLCIPGLIVCIHTSRVDMAGPCLIDSGSVSGVRNVEARTIQVDAKQVLTVEALADGGVLLPFQRAFRGHVLHAASVR